MIPAGNIQRFLVGLAVLMTGCVLALPAPAGASADLDQFFGVVSQRHVDAEDYDLMEYGRLGSFRLPVDWGSVEPDGDGKMRWGYVDESVEATARRGITFMPTLYNTPHWLTDDRKIMPLENSYQERKWSEFLLAAVERYGRDGDFWAEHPDVPYLPVRRWQIWNEPNIHNFSKPVSPRLYAKLVRISARAIRGFDPDAKIVLGGFYATPPDGTGIESSIFLKRMYRFPGTRQSFDIASVHPYAATTRESIKRTYPLRRMMNRLGNRKRPMIISELGWGSDSATVFGKKSQSGQARQVSSVYRAFLNQRSRLKLRSIYWFSWADLPPGSISCVFCMKTGFFDHRGDPKPSWYALLDFTHRN